MVASNFEACLDVTLEWEGGYSNHPDDPGGPTMHGIIQREYNAWRAKHGLALQPVRKISDDEVKAIYRAEYWDAMGCDNLSSGYDLVVFDAAVNNGVGRAKLWAEHFKTVDEFCNARLAFDRALGRLWRVFGHGWNERILGIRHQAEDLAAGRPIRNIYWVQEQLNKLGAALAVDGARGPATRAAIVKFQTDHKLAPDGLAGPLTLAAIETAVSLIS